MQTPLDRRQFLRQGLVLTGGALLLADGESVFGQGTRRAAAPAWLAALQGSARSFTWLGATAAAAAVGKSTPLNRLRVEVTDLAAFADALSRLHRLGAGEVQAGGVHCAFECQGRMFELEVREGADFQTAASTAAGRAAFAHDALALSVEGGPLSDALQARGELRLVRRSAGPEALGDVLRGRSDAAAAELRPDAAFVTLEKSVLSSTVADRATATATLRVFFSHMPVLLQTESEAAWNELLAAPLLRTAFQTRLGTTPEAVARRVQPARDAAAWLAAALADEIRAGYGPTWVGLGTLGAALPSLRAVQAAHQLLA
ncbi:MAG: hypothetical protein JSR82_08755 [Verrucomicrobia bacterium]|nr:hypothetical protein [Verrucomicrobiota bacterium]